MWYSGVSSLDFCLFPLIEKPSLAFLSLKAWKEPTDLIQTSVLKKELRVACAIREVHKTMLMMQKALISKYSNLPIFDLRH